MPNDNRLSKPIADCCDSLIRYLNGFEYVSGDYLTTPVVSEKFKEDVLEKHLSEPGFNYSIEVLKDDFKSEAVKEPYLEEVSKFNEGLDSKTRDFVILGAFQKSVNIILEPLLGIVQTEQSESDHIVKSFSYTSDELLLYSKLCVFFDYQIFLIVEKYPNSKNVFFSTLHQVLEILFNISAECIEKFWSYLESRVAIIEKVFNKNTTSDRIAMLEICNNLTDKYKSKNAQGKTDSYSKDTFNDTFQYRVRTFITNIFAFDDNTGLNRYFTTSNRIVSEFISSSKYNKDADFLRDILSLKRLFNDPYFYLKPNNHRLLSKVSETMRNITQYLIEDEKAHAKSLPKVDPALTKIEINKANATSVIPMPSVRSYFAESYWLSPFRESKRDLQFEEERKVDIDFFNSQLDVSKFRQSLLVQIYITSNFLFEMTSSNKRDFLSSLGAQTTVKHITDDSSPENLASSFLKIKREISNKLRDVDSSFSFLLQHLSLTEMFWWSWLIYGKDSSTGKPLFADKVLTELELRTTKEKSQSVFPFKVKRYFNTYGTPQLTRKMKIPVGLDILKSKGGGQLLDFENEIKQATDSLDSIANDKERALAREGKNIFLWKHLNLQRPKRWLQFGSLLTKEMLADESNDPRIVTKDIRESQKDKSKEEKGEVESSGNITPDNSQPESVQVELKVDEEPIKMDSADKEELGEAISAEKIDTIEGSPSKETSLAADPNPLKRALDPDSDHSDNDNKRAKV